MNKFFKKYLIKAKVYRFKSLLRIIYTDEKVLDRVQRDFFENNKLKKIDKIRKYLYEKIYITQ